jgi:hypothetical protein
MADGINPKVFQVRPDAFAIRAEAMVPGEGKIDGPNYSVNIPVQIFWCGSDWSLTVFQEFMTREEAEKHLAEKLPLMIKRARKQYGVGGNT